MRNRLAQWGITMTEEKKAKQQLIDELEKLHQRTEELEKLRAASRKTETSLMVSGFMETHRVKKALELGAGAYVRKSYILEKIGMAIRNELLSHT